VHELGCVIGQVEQRLGKIPKSTVTVEHTATAALLEMPGATIRGVSSVAPEEHRHHDSHVERCKTAGGMGI
jgi:hypothetical protein